MFKFVIDLFGHSDEELDTHITSELGSVALVGIFHNSWEEMTPEQKQIIREAMKNRWQRLFSEKQTKKNT